uniref:Surface antigen (D15) n=1 Tax=Sphingobacterium sp. (strain 21) TaxID=743722 RepID=F4C746_SPHS2
MIFSLSLKKEVIKQIACFLLALISVFTVHGQKAITLQEHVNPTLSLSVSELPDRILFQDMRTKAIVNELLVPGRGVGGLLTFSPDGQFLVASGNDGQTTIYALSRDTIRQLARLPFKTKLAAFSPVKKECVFVHSVKTFNARMTKYDTNTWKAIATRNIASDINAVDISYDGKLIGFTNNRLIQLLDYESLTKVNVNWEKEKQRLLIFHPNKQEIASVTAENNIQIRDFQDTLIREIKTGSSKITWLGYDRVGENIVSVDVDGRLSIWNPVQKNKEQELSNIFTPPGFTKDNNILIKKEQGWTTVPIDIEASQEIHDRLSSSKNHEGKRLKFLPQPIIGFKREAGFIVGAGATMIWYPKTGHASRFSQPTIFAPIVTYGFNGKQLAVGAYMEAYYKEKWYFTNNFLFTNNAKNYFFGIGRESNDRHKTAYVSDNFVLEGSVSRILSDQFFVGINYKLRKDNELDFEEKPTSNFHGGQGGWLFGIGPTLRMDKRNDVLFPTKGSRLEINYYWFNQEIISDYQYQELKFDYRKFIPVDWLVQGDVLAFQGMFNATWGGEAPFYQLPYITADRAFRGVWRNLYIAEQVFSVQAEYRSYFSSADRRFGYAIFAGLGDGAKNFFKDYKASIKAFYGVGFRQQLIPRYRLYTRVDFGLTSKGDFGAFAGTGVAF